MAAPTVHQSNVPPRRTGGDGALHLTIMGPNVFETYPLPARGSVRIGRDETAEVRITDDLASRLHARLDVDSATEVAVEDLNSMNGTFVRGERIEAGARIVLQPGEALTIGFTHLMVQRRRPPTQLRRFHGHGAFEERLEDACARAGETNTAHAVLRLQVTDEDPPGRAADAIAAALRPGDFLAQYARGDYEVLLYDTDPTRADALGDEAARRLRTEGLEVKTAVACFPGDGRSAEALIGRGSALLRGADAADARDPVLKSEVMRALYRLAGRAADGPTANGLINVLILGETGVGKEVLADWIHRHSSRARGPFVCINCAALSDALLESELFGYEKGAFTGAVQAKPGLLETAAGGTVFLDEIGEMPAALQTRLLRALESRQIVRVGGLAPRAIDVRFVAATNRDLETEVLSKTFRQDLYFRLNGISLTIPPLRERPEEIEPLARRFLAAAAGPAKRRPPRLTPDALESLEAYAWPGNIRELRNVVERALLFAEGNEIAAEHLPVEKMRLSRLVAASPPSASAAVPVALDPSPAKSLSPAEEAEYRKIVAALAEHGYNQTRAAKALGISRGTLIQRMKRYGIKRPQA